MAKYTGKYAQGRKSGLLVPILAVVLLLGLITAGVAYYLQETGGVTASYQLAQVSCQVDEKFDGTQKTEIKVRNTSNVPAYIRVRLVSYWETPSGKIAGRSSPELKDLSVAGGWQAMGDNTWLYATPVEPGESTEDLLAASLTLEAEDGYIPVVKVLAEAIQESAATDAWRSKP